MYHTITNRYNLSKDDNGILYYLVTSYIMYRRITIVYIHDCITTYRVTKYDNHVFTIKYNVSYHPH